MFPPSAREPTVDRRAGAESTAALRRSVAHGLLRKPRSLPSRLFYDEHGSRLFEAICALPEYYPTRVERALLADTAGEIAARCGADVLVELGAGAATKTRLLLDALHRPGRPLTYVPVDVSEATVRRVAGELVAEYPGLRVRGIVGDFLQAFEGPPPEGRRLVIFLGGTIGNLDPEAEAPPFVAAIGAALAPGEAFLLGTDLVKDRAVLEAAYNDAQGITAAFNRNILKVANRLLDADFEPGRFVHRAFWDPGRRWIEMRLVATAPQEVRLRAVGATLLLEAGEEIRTEISAKYDRPRVETLLAGAGLTLERWLTDPRGYFALSLARKA